MVACEGSGDGEGVGVDRGRKAGEDFLTGSGRSWVLFCRRTRTIKLKVVRPARMANNNNFFTVVQL